MKPAGTARVAGVAIAAAVLACSAVTTTMILRLDQHLGDRERADARAYGTVIQDGIDDADDIRVRWTDDSGERHVSRFGIYDTDKYVKGAQFVVRYDRSDPDRAAFPADADETSAEDDMYAGAILPWVLVVTVVTWWLIRLIRARRARRGPLQNSVATIFCAHNELAGPLSALVRTTWVRIGVGTDAELQRVMWHPSLSSAGYDEPVFVTRGGGAASVVLADGSRLSPIGRLRATAPDRYALEELPATRASLADTIVRRHSTARDPWLRSAALRAVYGALLGAGIGALVASATLIWIGAAVGAALTLNLWALHGADR